MPPTVIGRLRSGRLRAATGLGLVAVCTGPLAGAYLASTPRPAWGPAAVAAGACVFLAGVVRVVRCGLTVTDAWIERRSLLSSWRLPWAEVTRVAADREVLVVGSPVRMRVERTPGWTAKTSTAVVAAIEQAVGGPVPTPVVADPAQPTYTWPGCETPVSARDPVVWPANAAAVLLVVLWIAGAVFVGSGAEQVRLGARATRELPATAAVEDWTVRSTDDGDETEVQLRFRSATGEDVTAAVVVSGDQPPEPELMDIVYDPAHPTDVDFADRRSHRHEEWMADVVRRISAVVALHAAAGLVLMAFVGLRLWVSASGRVPSLRASTVQLPA